MVGVIIDVTILRYEYTRSYNDVVDTANWSQSYNVMSGDVPPQIQDPPWLLVPHASNSSTPPPNKRRARGTIRSSCFRIVVRNNLEDIHNVLCVLCVR